ncbi:MAG: phosphate ABC transporter substrate-binding protein, partial [Christensenellales bacterium]
MILTTACAGAEGISGMINVISREDGSGTRGAFVELTGIEVKDEDGNKI